MPQTNASAVFTGQQFAPEPARLSVRQTAQPSAISRMTMKAIRHDSYGAIGSLTLRDVDTPMIKDDQVLVRVRAAGLHIGDCFGVRGSPYLMRLHSGLVKPKYGVPGFDVAGVVEAVGSKVTRFEPGDKVFGECNGACAEFACVSETKLVKKPANLDFESAAAVPTSALAALHALRDVAGVRPGQKVLINGASGGVGTFAIQIAKSYGAHVTAVCSATNAAMVRSIGADEVVDYTRQDFTLDGPRYDVILDNIENRSLADCRRALKADGCLILNSGTGASGFGMLVRLFKPLLLSPFARQRLCRYLSVPGHEDLNVLKRMLEAGQMKPVIDKTFTLGKTADALRYIENGHTSGKVVVIV
ncbi:MAG: NAD(P)-dependent alcohol dehydrogenase [Granulosicoccus sp.]